MLLCRYGDLVRTTAAMKQILFRKVILRETGRWLPAGIKIIYWILLDVIQLPSMTNALTLSVSWWLRLGTVALFQNNLLTKTAEPFYGADTIVMIGQSSNTIRNGRSYCRKTSVWPLTEWPMYIGYDCITDYILSANEAFSNWRIWLQFADSFTYLNSLIYKYINLLIFWFMTIFIWFQPQDFLF